MSDWALVIMCLMVINFITTYSFEVLGRLFWGGGVGGGGGLQIIRHVCYTYLGMTKEEVLCVLLCKSIM